MNLPQDMRGGAGRVRLGSDGDEHRGPAVVALHDRRVLPAVRAHGHELVALQAVHAAVAARDGRRPQPRLVAVGALRTEVDRGLAHVEILSLLPACAVADAPLAAHRASAAYEARDEEPVRAVAMREQAQ